MARVSMEELLQELVERDGSDLHIVAGSPPRIRVDGRLINVGSEPLDADDTQRLIYGILDNEQIARFERDLELDLSFGISGLGRFRTNVYMQRGTVAAALRRVPWDIWTLEKLGLPVKLLKDLCHKPKGLVLVTGATGSGKSTTLATMLDYINQIRQGHIVTIEDPIEFVHRHKGCVVSQREIGSDTRSFHAALRSVLRQDPDVILIGEMRDKETIETALTLAETGHLTLATLHTSDCVQTINRIIDVFPDHQQQQVRTQLSFVLQAIICQQLMPRASGRGQVLAAEILVATGAVRSLIRDDKIHQIYSVMQTSGRLGMRTMNQALAELVRARKITEEEAFARSTDYEEMRRLLHGSSS
ncbi:MAG: type IV pili twitching motility protein PilT [Planctomycetota bacterium]|nr:MAG: type IV pili twitching motility protein PilT [Planctomycetota bacterium]